MKNLNKYIILFLLVFIYSCDNIINQQTDNKDINDSNVLISYKDLSNDNSDVQTSIINPNSDIKQYEYKFSILYNGKEITEDDTGFEVYWDFGDKSSSNQKIVQHRYEKEGLYKVTAKLDILPSKDYERNKVIFRKTDVVVGKKTDLLNSEIMAYRGSSDDLRFGSMEYGGGITI